MADSIQPSLQEVVPLLSPMPRAPLALLLPMPKPPLVLELELAGLAAGTAGTVAVEVVLEKSGTTGWVHEQGQGASMAL